jgi:hypothetical protein
MMRALFSIAALLVVLYLVMQLGGKQLEALKPSAGRAPTDGATAGPASDGRPASPPANAATETARRVTDAMQQGADQRASEASR